MYTKTHSGGQISTPDINIHLRVLMRIPNFEPLGGAYFRNVPEFVNSLTINTTDVNQSNFYQIQTNQRPHAFRQIQAL